MVMSQDQYAVQNHNIQTGYKILSPQRHICFDPVEEFAWSNDQDLCWL